MIELAPYSLHQTFMPKGIRIRVMDRGMTFKREPEEDLDSLKKTKKAQRFG